MMNLENKNHSSVGKPRIAYSRPDENTQYQGTVKQKSQERYDYQMEQEDDDKPEDEIMTSTEHPTNYPYLLPCPGQVQTITKRTPT